MQVGIVESLRSEGMRQTLIETMGASQTRGIVESENADKKPVMKTVCNGDNNMLSERTAVGDKNEKLETQLPCHQQEYLNLAVSNLDLVLQGSRKNGNIPDIVNFSPYKNTLLNEEKLNEDNFTDEQISEHSHDPTVIDGASEQDCLCNHSNRSNDFGAENNDIIKGNCYNTNHIQTSVFHSETLLNENSDGYFQNHETDIPESTSKDDGIEDNDIGHYFVSQSESSEVFNDKESGLGERRNSYNGEIQHFERNSVRLSTITQESGFYDHYNQSECILTEGQENCEVPLSTLESGFVDHDMVTDNFEVSDSEFHDCDLYVTNSFENQNLYVQDTSSIGWESNYMCTCDDCLRHLRIERIQTEDKCTMCPEEPPYVLMCEICEG